MQPAYEIVTTSAGALSIRDNLANEIMHNPVGPWVEANALYIEQSQLQKRLLESPDQELIIFDIGLGAGTNAIAAIRCFLDLPNKQNQKLKIISFEKKCELLQFALSHANQFEHFKSLESAVHELLISHQWKTTNLIWELRHGDFLELLDTEKEKPHIIFFDPYSPKINQEVWTAASFKKLRSICRSNEDGGTVLYTYSLATPVRAAMLIAGFFVGHGMGTGLKTETTEAATNISLLKSPLGTSWLTRWKKSHTPYPYDFQTNRQNELDHMILDHPQFSSCQ